MRLTTPIDLPENELDISYDSGQMIIGSCFAENIGKRLLSCKFRILQNPFGILYNPLSIATALQRIISGKPFTDDSTEIVFHNELWHSMLHHGEFSRKEKEQLLSSINERLSEAHRFIQKLDILTLTLGTAYVYRRKSDGIIVGNCHKIPANEFTRSLVSVDEITDALIPVFETLKKINSKIKFLLTVSPIRHIRDGAHGNQISKSILLLATEELKRRFPDIVFYFPAYEIMLDELRDYRFYDEDLVHPSKMAVDYVWECFRKCYFNDKTDNLAMQIEEINKALSHRPFDATSQAYMDFISKILLKIDDIKKKHTFFDFSNEIEKCRTQLNK